MHSRCVLRVATVIVSCGLASCGTVVPNIKEAWDKDYPGDPTTKPPTPPITGAAQIEYEIKKNVYCELKHAVITAQSYAETEVNGKKVVKTNSFIPPKWGAQITLSLEVDESSAFSPGFSLNTPMPNALSYFGVLPAVTTAQSFSLGLGGTLSSTATRIDKFDPYYTIAELSKPITSEGVCNSDHPENDPFVHIHFTPASSSPLIIESDLGIKDWLVGAMFTNDQIPSVSAPPPPTPTPKSLAAERRQLAKEGYTAAEITQILASKASGSGASTGSDAGASSGSGGGATKPDTVSLEIKFVIVSSGSVTPTWKLVRVSANAGAAPFFGVGRIRTHDLIITIGPPTQATANTHLASEIGQAVSDDDRALLNSSFNALTFPSQ